MGNLMIKCPKTGCEISTGIQMDRSTFQSMPVFFARTLCPICQTQHEWFARAAWVQEPKAKASSRSTWRGSTDGLWQCTSPNG